MPRRALQSGALLKFDEGVARSGAARLSGGGDMRASTSLQRTLFILKQTFGGSALQNGATLQRAEVLTVRSGAARLGGGGLLTVVGVAGRRQTHRISGGGSMRADRGTRILVPATGVGGWRS